MKTGAEQITWNLEDLYPSIDSPEFTADKQRIYELADTFSTKYRGKVNQLSSEELLELAKEEETMSDLMSRLGSYIHLLWSTDTQNTTYGKLLAEISEMGSAISQKTLFFNVEWNQLEDEQVQQLLNDPKLASFRYFFENLRVMKPYLLEEKAEQVLSAKSTTSNSAWVRYFDETLGAAEFLWEGEKVTEQEILGKLSNPDRTVRKKASESMTYTLNNIKRSLTFCFNTLLQDKATNDALRDMPSWLTGRNLSNEIDDATVDALVNSVKSAYPVVQSYYTLKKQLLEVDELFEYDRYAPILKTETNISWEEAKKMVIEAYSEFHPEMGAITQRFFDERWIDAAIRPGKRSGAYSASTACSVHPYVFMNFDGKLRDVQTLAHELGHGVHQYLSREQGPLLSGTPLTTAETASVFGEMLVFQRLLSTITDPKEKLALLMSKIDDSIATVFRQISMNQFENAIHTARRTQGELSTEEFNELWMKTQKDLYGNAVTLTENYHLWWSYIPHFLHTPGYVYAYAFGELLVLSLYELYKEGEEGFSEKYLTLLRAGGSDRPEHLLAPFNMDIQSPDFWNKGLAVFQNMVKEAQELAAQLSVHD